MPNDETDKNNQQRQGQKRVTACCLEGERSEQQDRSRSRAKHIHNESSKNKALRFYNEILAKNSNLRGMCRERAVFDETLLNWKDQGTTNSISPLEAIQYLRDVGLIHHSTKNTKIIWTVDLDNMIMTFYDTVLRNNPERRLTCTNRRVLNDTINRWEVEQHLRDSATTSVINIPASMYVSTLLKLGMIKNKRKESTLDKIVWADSSEEVQPFTEEQHSRLASFDQKQLRDNIAAISFYNQMLKYDQILRRACAYRNIMEDVINEWKQLPLHAGDPPKEGVASASIIYELTYKWGLIDHVNAQQGIVAWKEDVQSYKDGVIQWKNLFPVELRSREKFDLRRQQMRNECAAIAAISFYISKIRDNPQLRCACAYRQFLNDTIDVWKNEPVKAGDPPRNVPRSNIIHQLQKQWTVIRSFNNDTVVWTQDTSCDTEMASLFSMLSTSSSENTFSTFSENTGTNSSY
jgi:hypothetical protein